MGAAIGGATGALGGYLRRASFEKALVYNSDNYLALCDHCKEFYKNFPGVLAEDAYVYRWTNPLTGLPISGGAIKADYFFEEMVIGGKVISGGLKLVGATWRAIRGVTNAAKTGSTTLYRAISKAELDDIAINGIRNSPGYETGKLFATSAQDAANFGRLNFGLDKQPFTIIKTSIPNKYSPMLYRGEMDLMQGVSVPSNLFNQLSKPSIFNKTPLPNHPWIK